MDAAQPASFRRGAPSTPKEGLQGLSSQALSTGPEEAASAHASGASEQRGLCEPPQQHLWVQSRVWLECLQCGSGRAVEYRLPPSLGGFACQVAGPGSGSPTSGCQQPARPVCSMARVLFGDLTRVPGSPGTSEFRVWCCQRGLGCSPPWISCWWSPGEAAGRSLKCLRFLPSILRPSLHYSQEDTTRCSKILSWRRAETHARF